MSAETIAGEAGEPIHNIEPALPFEDSRRLTGPNLYFVDSGAVLETLGLRGTDPIAIEGWRRGVKRMRAQLEWPSAALTVRLHPGGAALAMVAPVDLLYAATELNEWAWLAALSEAVLHAPGHPAAWDEISALRTLQAMCADEAKPRLRALIDAAAARGLPVLADDEALTLGLGCGGRTWPLSDLPKPFDIDWTELHAVPTALITGSNGKTTTVRLLAAMLRAHGDCTGHSCTDGVFVDGTQIASGDYSGPGGARAVLRDSRVQAAVLETARGGLLRRGLALTRADVACVTNISVDHFGEYGIHSLEDLADAKLTVARALGPDGVLVLNADDPVLAARGPAFAANIAWFALDDDHPALCAQRAAGGATCGVRDGVLRLRAGASIVNLGSVSNMPLAAGGEASYNIANAAAASLLAQALNVPPLTIAAVLARFGDDPADNPGRLQRWSFGGLRILLDYAHNPDGLRGLLRVARAGECQRLGLLLGQAGNREDTDIRALARTAAEAAPDRVVLKDIEGYIRGRAVGEVAELLGEELRACGLPAERLQVHLPEVGAVRELLAWARPGDVLVLPVHALSARAEAIALLEALRAAGWQAGQMLPC
ncbi:Mur ligase family protein [Aquimonas sp.]|uniref:Mur ligase family protein n=1 Tax=Aquimonas sp. TaxID=1872588 RepID=UPI0037BF6959